MPMTRFRRVLGRDHWLSRMFLLLSLALAATITVGQDPEVVRTDVCSLVAHPKQFNEKRVRIEARVETVVVEGGIWLYDCTCGQRGVELVVPDAIQNNEDFKALDDAIVRRGYVGTVGKRITAAFTGKFASHSRRPKRVLVLEKVENLVVAMEGADEPRKDH